MNTVTIVCLMSYYANKKVPLKKAVLKYINV